MPLVAALAGATLAAAVSGPVQPVTGLVHFVNYSGEPVILTVDDEAPRTMDHATIQGFTAASSGRLIKVASEQMTVEMHADLPLAAGVPDAKGRPHWCFVAAPRSGIGVQVVPLAPDQCAELVLAGRLGEL
jgi:hypothetical protein